MGDFELFNVLKGLKNEIEIKKGKFYFMICTVRANEVEVMMI